MGTRTRTPRERRRPAPRSDRALRTAGRLALLVLLGSLRTAAAQPAAGGGSGLYDVQSAGTTLAGSYFVSLTGAAYRVRSDREPGSAGDRGVVDGGVQITLGAADWLEVFARFDAPIVSNDAGTFVSARDGLVGAKADLPVRSKWLQLGAWANVTVPWGRTGRGFSSGSADPGAGLLLTVPVFQSAERSSGRLHVNLGYRRRADGTGHVYEGKPRYFLEPAHPATDGDRVDVRAAFEYAARNVTIFAEAILDRLAHEEIRFGEGPIFLTPGFRLALSDRWSLLAAAKLTLAIDDESTSEFRAPEDMFPDWQLGLALSWSRFGRGADRDEDGVPDFRDRCPRTPEDIDEVGDHDGCPERE